jgi:F0F1-type ATP synthase assembly protein I
MKNKNLLQTIIAIVMIFLSVTIIFVYIGILLDKFLKSSPVFLIIFAILSIFLSLYLIYIYNVKNL